MALRIIFYILSAKSKIWEAKKIDPVGILRRYLHRARSDHFLSINRASNSIAIADRVSTAVNDDTCIVPKMINSSPFHSNLRSKYILASCDSAYCRYLRTYAMISCVQSTDYCIKNSSPNPLNPNPKVLFGIILNNTREIKK